MSIPDYAMETEMLLSSLESKGFKVDSVDNGEYVTKFNPNERKKFIEDCMACEESHLYVISPTDNKKKWLFLVYGNCLGELVCDYVLDNLIEEVVMDHYDKLMT